MVQRRIMLLLDNLVIRREISSYAIDLALRMEANLYLLILLYITPDALEEGFQEAESVLNNFLEDSLQRNVKVHGTIRQGDPASELLKYLAESRPFQAIIWGGKEQLLRNKGIPVRTHWLEQIRKKLECPLVVPSLKEKQ